MAVGAGRRRRWLRRRPREVLVGVDVRQSEIRLVRYDRTAGQNISLARVPGCALKTALGNAVKHLRLTGARAAAAIESSRVVARHTTLPPMPAEEVGPALAYQLPQLIPGYKDTWMHDYVPLGRDYLVAALPRGVVLEYHAAFKQAGLKLMSLEIRALALQRFLFGVRGGRGEQAGQPRVTPPACLAVLDPDDTTADLAVFENGVLRYTRLLAGWGVDETRDRIPARLVAEVEESLLWYREHRGDPPGTLMVVCGPAGEGGPGAVLAGRLGLEVYCGTSAWPDTEGTAPEFAAAVGLSSRGVDPP